MSISVQFLTSKQTLATAEFARPSDPLIRARKSDELIHYRDEESNPICAACGCIADIWMNNEGAFNDNPARCQTYKSDDL